MSVAEIVYLPETHDRHSRKTRRQFLAISATTGLSIIAAALSSHIPDRVPVSQDPEYAIFPGWLEQNIGDDNIPLLDQNGFVKYQSSLMRNNFVIRSAYRDFMTEMLEMRSLRSRLRLGDSFQRAFDLTSTYLQEYSPNLISPATNMRRELVHAGLIVHGKSYNWYGSVADLEYVAIDTKDLHKTTDLYQDKDFGLAATVMPLVFGYKPNEVRAISRAEQLTSVSGADHGPHIAQHATLTEQIEYYRRYNLEPTAPLPNIVKWYSDRSNSDIQAAQQISWLAGHLHELVGTLRPQNWPILEQRPAEGYFEMYGNARQDLKANYLGSLIAERLIKIADQEVSFEIFRHNVAEFFDTLNDFRYQSALTPATLDLPPIEFNVILPR